MQEQNHAEVAGLFAADSGVGVLIGLLSESNEFYFLFKLFLCVSKATEELLQLINFNVCGVVSFPFELIRVANHNQSR